MLFIAEKLAALEVVKQRLDRAGLGDFCLELHSHKTQKRKVLDEIDRRLKNQGQFRKPAEIEADIKQYESLKNELKNYVEMINLPWKKTGKSIHDIFMTATRFREQLKKNPAEFYPEGFDGWMFNTEVQRHSQDLVRTFGQVFNAIDAKLEGCGNLKDHPWYGVGNTNLQFFDIERVCEVLEGWQLALIGLLDARKKVLSVLACEENTIPDNVNGLLHLRNDINRIPDLHGDEFLFALKNLQGKALFVFHRFLTRFEDIQSLYTKLDKHVTSEVFDDLKKFGELLIGYERLCSLVGQDITLSSLVATIKRLNNLEVQLQKLSQIMTKIAKILGSTWSEILDSHEKGLAELKKLLNIITELKPGLWKQRDNLFDDDELDEQLPKLKKEITSLKQIHEALANHFNLENIPATDELKIIKDNISNESFFRWFNHDWRVSRKRLLGLRKKSELGLRVLIRKLDLLITFSHKKEELEKNQNFKSLLVDKFKGIGTDIDDLIDLRSWYRDVRKEYGAGFSPRVALGQAILDLHTQYAQAIRSLVEQGIHERIETVVGELEKLKSVFCFVDELQQGYEILIGPNGLLAKLQAGIKNGLVPCQCYSREQDISLLDMGQWIESFKKLRILLAEWMSEDINIKWFKGKLNLIPGLNSENDQVLAAAKHTETLATIIDKQIDNQAIKVAIYDNPEPPFFLQLVELSNCLEKKLQTHNESFQQFETLVSLDREAWQIKSGDLIKRLTERNELALSNPQWLSNWLDYIRFRYQMKTSGFERLAMAVERGVILTSEIEGGYLLGIYDLLSREILKEKTPLANFSGIRQETIQNRFCEYDDKLKCLNRELIAWKIAQNEIPIGKYGLKVSEFTEKHLLMKECSKKKRHIPIRQLVKRAGAALVALKPCFMMGPMSAAQYLAPGEIKFDLIIMDEASQIKPEDSIGAIARGQQLIVVGDPKQLPPTNFFEKLIEDDLEETTSIEESESILDVTSTIFNNRRLGWHYRSKHESLIAFSNHFFYDGDLVLFPYPQRENDEFGVKFSRVPGRFINRRNIEEAKLIAKKVREHFSNRHGESLGIVAMNVEQRDQLERAVEELAKEDEQFQILYEQNSASIEPLFIKNLENVQGDERDVIFISFTYGPQEIGGKVLQRFGPINSEMGWRRLNVLFTRSRKRMHVFSSMDSNDIIVNETSNKGVQSLKNFLCYADTGKLPMIKRDTDRIPDSDFEVAVASALRDEGFECKPQVGVAGFFIDIAVIDPGKPGRFIMGIECDGKSYHSAKSVRDRDRLRQAVLVDIGWRIKRIWSTDWYKNPRAVLQPIIRELNQLKTTEVPSLEKPLEVKLATNIDITKELDKKTVKPYTAQKGELKEKLIRFDKEVIRVELPNVPDDKRLLRPSMIEALLKYRPTCKSEFWEIPLYLRDKIDLNEAKQYLERVFEIIEESWKE